MEDQKTKKCQFCGEEILEVAIKCKHCGSNLMNKDAIENHNDKESNKETLGLFILIIPVAASFLSVFWIGGLQLIDNPMSKLLWLSSITIIATAVLAALEANNNGVGKRKKEAGPIVVFIGLMVFWIIFYPRYLFDRKKYGLKNLLLPGLVITVIFSGSFFYMVNEIDQAERSFRYKVEESEKELRENIKKEQERIEKQIKDAQKKLEEEY